MQDHSITFYCKQCGKPFKSTSSKTARPNPQFCSNHCSAVDKANKKRRTDYPIHTCETCGKEFEHRRQGSLGRFCSQTCTMKSVNAKKNTSMWVTKTCPYCGEFFTHRQEKIDRIFFSPRCSTLHHRHRFEEVSFLLC